MKLFYLQWKIFNSLELGLKVVKRRNGLLDERIDEIISEIVLSGTRNDSVSCESEELVLTEDTEVTGLENNMDEESNKT